MTQSSTCSSINLELTSLTGEFMEMVSEMLISAQMLAKLSPYRTRLYLNKINPELRNLQFPGKSLMLELEIQFRCI